MRFRISASQHIGPGMYVSVGKRFGGHVRRHIKHHYLAWLGVMLLMAVVLAHLGH